MTRPSLLSPPMRSILYYLLALWLCFGACAPLRAQTAPEPTGPTGPVMTAGTGTGRAAPNHAATEGGIAEMKRKMGLLFWPMVALSIFTIMLILYNSFTIRQNALLSAAFMNS